jgi:hypothetical protein
MMKAGAGDMNSTLATWYNNVLKASGFVCVFVCGEGGVGGGWGRGGWGTRVDSRTRPAHLDGVGIVMVYDCPTAVLPWLSRPST